MKKKIILLMIIFSAAVFGQSKVGSTAAPFLNIGIGPRAVSMGGAFVATANDATSLYWNPAGAARLNGNSVYFSHSQWFVDIAYNWAGLVFQLGDLGTMGLSLTYLDYGDIEVTTLAAQDGTGEFYNPSDLSLAFTYAYNLTDRFAIGGNVKYIRQTIWNSSASSVALDIGVLFQSDIYGLRIGSSITNFGSDMQIDGKDLYVQHDIDPQQSGNNDEILAKLNTDKYPIPLTFRVGIAMDLLNYEDHLFTIGVDALHPNDNDESLNIGAEYNIFRTVSLRAGYKSLFLDNSEEGLTLGFGISYDLMPGFGLQVDYAYQDFGILDNTQHFSLGVKF
ncbi:MAG: PorV/PorQ family protein [Ignavibacteriales bacterium]|nr:PorV/PorQ family protein [Ignavibacteriales bacterium]MCF8306936.1 PorV/PorQ family protein [Ignavibacteriales bacterium]MCF8437376.1 PorV/PorQ family protein [Ignavibacteriales bacterium]